MQNIKIKIFVVLLVITGISYSCSKKKKEEKKASDKKIMTVDAIIAKTQNIDYIFSINGTLLANETVDIKPEISGRVTKIFFNEGTFVNKGKLLVKVGSKK